LCLRSIKVGGSSCAQNLWFSDSSILCKVPGAGAQLFDRVVPLDSSAVASW
jgi:hypothetical protein